MKNSIGCELNQDDVLVMLGHALQMLNNLNQDYFETASFAIRDEVPRLLADYEKHQTYANIALDYVHRALIATEDMMGLEKYRETTC